MHNLKTHRAAQVADLRELLTSRAQEDPGLLGFRWLVDGEKEGPALTYAALNDKATAIAAALQALKLDQKVVLLSYPPGLEFIEAFFGCLYAGMIAVPVPALTSMRERPRMEGILADAKCGLILGPTDSLPMLAELVRTAGSNALCRTTNDLNASDHKYRAPRLRSEQIAYLQYTSGSTSAPKGVMIRHGNVLANLEHIAGQGAFDSNSVSVSWLPHFHDMGLIYGILQPIFNRFPAVLFSPAAYLHRPIRWLSAITRYRGTHCGAPNFAYDFCVQRIHADLRSDLDLSSWKVAFNGAEPVRAETLERFADYFADCGFQRKAFYPVYGLAEASLKVSSREPGSGAEVIVLDREKLKQQEIEMAVNSGANACTVVSCGNIKAPNEVVIVDPATREHCPDGQAGEIWTAGPSVAAGYWRKPAETKRVFKATLARGRKHFLRTGDLGFIHHGELFIVGRLKDCIIIHGQNHYAEDIENTVRRCGTGLRSNGMAAFAVEHAGREELVVVVEVAKRTECDLEQLAARVREAITETHEIKVHTVVLIRSGALPRTSSGKVQRSKCKSQFLARELPVLWQSEIASEDEAVRPARKVFTREQIFGAPAGSRIEILRECVSTTASEIIHSRAEALSGDRALAALGFDSLMIFELKRRIEDEIGVSVPITELLNVSLNEIAAWIGEHSDIDERRSQAELPTTDSPSAIPLSWMQQQIWFVQQMYPESCAYNQLFVLRLKGALNRDALQNAIAEIIRRHEVLRTVVISSEGAWIQRISTSHRPELQVVPISAAVIDKDAELKNIAEDAAKAPFHTGELLLRLRLLRLDAPDHTAQDHALVLVAHHVVCDGGSIRLLVRELGALYASFVEGRAAALPELNLQYRDFVFHEQALTRQPAFQGQLDYWQKQLADVPVLDLPTDFPRPPVLSDAGASVAWQLDREQTEAFAASMRREGVTPFMGVLAAFQLLLSRYTGQDDVAVGTAITNRDLKGSEDLIGVFVNTVVLRTRIKHSWNVRDLLSEVRRITTEGFERRFVPFAQVVERVRPDRDLSRTPLFQVMLVFQPDFQQEFESGSLRFECFESQTGAVKCDAVLRVVETSPCLRGYLDYSAKLFAAPTMERMAIHLQSLLQQVSARPDANIGTLSFLSERELQQVVVDWNHTSRPYDEAKSVSQLFELQASKTPAAVAAVDDAECLTYDELNRQANRLASHLRTHGVGPEVPVGICLRRSLTMLTALLAVLKSGGIFVPLDPELPAERLGYMIGDMNMSLMITEESLSLRLPQSDAIPILVDGGPDCFLAESDGNLTCTISPENAAYVIYTSGSTGLPKGVVVQQGSLLNYMVWVKQTFFHGEIECLPATTSLGFDACLKQQIGPLISGGTVFLVGDFLQEPRRLLDLLSRNARPALNCVPSVWQHILAEIEQSGCASKIGLVRLILGGEGFSGELIRRAVCAIPGMQVSNLYGPTEATANATYAPRNAPDQVSIGKPIANTQVYVLDNRMRPVGIGMRGELYIGGDGVARGYHKQPGLTAERFVPDPFSSRRGARLYRTGDLAKWRASGDLELIGRADEQVKIRGYRIEPGEIESALLACRVVEQAAVLVHENESGNRQLVAYVVSKDNSEPIAELKNHLKQRLPDYMVPSAFVFLDRLPLLPTGKLDRKSLPLPAAVRQESRAPRTRPEEILCELFSEVLALPRVGIDENFFELGGHSLLAMRLASRIRNVLGAEMAIQTLFEKPTVSELAVILEQETVASVPLHAVSRPEKLPLSHAQQRLWFLDQFPGLSTAYILAEALQIDGDPNPVLLEKAVNEIVARHESLRTCFGNDSGRPFQIIQSRHIPLPVDELDPEEQTQVAQVNRLLLEETQTPFDLTRGPLLRTRLLRLGDRRHVLLCAMHHIISDGWSVQIMMEEIARLYAAFAAGTPPSLAPLEIQYADYVLWEQSWLKGELLRQQMDYWKKQLAAVPVLNLTGDRVRPRMKNYHGAEIAFTIDAILTERLENLGRQEGATLFMVTLALFQMLLSKYAGQQDVAVGVAIANRKHIRTEPLIGLFVNTLVLRSNVRDGISWKTFLGEVRKTTLAAYQNQDVPFEMLVEELQLKRELNRTPLFQAMLVFQNFPQNKQDFGGLQIEPLPNQYPPLRSDLDLYVGLRQGVLHSRLVYDPELFERESVAAMVNTFEQLVREIVERPDAALMDLLFPRPALPSPVAIANLHSAGVPLSYHQERMWFVDRFETGVVYASNPVYHNLVIGARLQGELDANMLEKALQQLIQRHNVLQMCFAEQNGQICQYKNENAADVLRCAPLIHEESLGDAAVLKEYAMKAMSAPFRLDKGPLIRAHLHSGRKESLLLLSAHHIVADRWSMLQFLEELAELYTAIANGRDAQLPTIEISYNAFARWQRDLDEKDWEPYWQYWKRGLHGELVNLELPQKCARHAVHVYHAGAHSFAIKPELAAQLKTIAAAWDISTASLLLASYYVLLHLYSGQQGFCVGMPISGHSLHGIKNAAGPFSNLIVVKGDPKGCTFAEFAKTIANNVERAVSYGAFPFDLLVRKLKIPNDMSRTALFDVLFCYREERVRKLQFASVRAEEFETAFGHGKYDLSMMLSEDGEGWSVELIYNDELYDAQTIEQLERHWQTMLTTISIDPEVRISEIKLLSAIERTQQLQDWNATAAEYPTKKTLHQIFEEQVETAPDRIALRFTSAQISYFELNARANSLAYILRNKGVKPDTLVGLCVERSLEMVIAILGILKAGGAYLPLDPSYPESRLRYILDDAGAAHVVTTKALQSKVDGNGRTITILDAEPAATNATANNPPSVTKPRNLAYCIYTSGSTGQPNGVLVEHRQAVRLMKNEKFYFDVGSEDIWTLFHSHTFDFSVWELWGALLYGGSLVVVNWETARDPRLFVELLLQHNVTVLNQTPGSFYNIVSELLEQAAPGLALRYVIFGGEALQPSYLKTWKDSYTDTALVNMYGITETTVHVTYREIGAEDIEQGRSCIGRPIPTTRTFILDERMELVPPGVTGEIFVGGDGLARGYLNRPGLTADRFVPDPFGDIEGSRLYRTGDLGKFMPDGNMVYQGRRDHQVKIRGFRIELGEIQAALKAEDGIVQAAVIARDDSGHGRELVAYLVPAPGVTIDNARLRQKLCERLPEYMVPAAFVVLDKLPLTSNLKLDRKALPAPEMSTLGYTAPRTQHEEIVCAIFAEVLSVPRIGIHDNFFELGGHSLLATQIVSRLRKEFSMDLPLHTLFEEPTVAGLVDRISQYQEWQIL